MTRALELAARGRYTTTPNPRVGCVLVRDGRVVGEGWHLRPGEPHAETLALQGDTERGRGADCYVTLEPCAHHGRTPPCADALVAAGVARVVAALVDPNPLVSGKGLAALAAAGIPVQTGLLGAEAGALNAGFLRRMSAGMPYVRVKLAISLDGRTAAADGGSQWISGDEARAEVQRLRAQSCAVLTGSGTVLADDPRLDVRIPETGGRQPLRVVLDRRLRCAPTARIFQPPGRATLFTTGQACAARAPLLDAGVDVIVVEDGEKGFLHACMAWLAQNAAINDVLVECGAELAGALLAARLVDELLLFQSAVLLGDRGRPLAQLPGLQSMADRIAFEQVDARRIGGDWMLVLKPVAG